MDCSGFRARHLDYLDNSLDERTLVACARHRAECAACAALDTRVRRSLLLCHNVADPLPSCDLTARVMAGVRADRRRQAQRRVQWARFGAVASVCVVCALAALPWLAPRRADHAQPVSLVQAELEDPRRVDDTPATFEPMGVPQAAFQPVARGPLDSVPRPSAGPAAPSNAFPVQGGRDANLLLLTSFSP